MKSKIIQLIYFAIAAPTIMLLLALPLKVMAQNTPPLHPKLEALAKPQSNRNWIDFREGTSINPATIFSDLKDAFELSVNDEMKVNKI